LVGREKMRREFTKGVRLAHRAYLGRKGVRVSPPDGRGGERQI